MRPGVRRIIYPRPTAVNSSTRVSFWEGHDVRLATHAAHTTDPDYFTLDCDFHVPCHWLHLAVPPFKTGWLVFGGGLRGGLLGALAGNVFRGL